MDTKEKIGQLAGNISKVIKGKPEVVRLAVVSLLARGHLLIEDVPGIGKTTLAFSLARSIDCGFHRVQFTSDLMPSDIVGVTVFNQNRSEFEFKPGPIFANIVLADEINRTTPKTQSALLEAMNEGQVTVENDTHALPRPFMVIATQNPLEFQGTYPLPESQMDRFIMRIRLGYPAIGDEKAILQAASSKAMAESLSPVLHAQDIVALQEQVLNVKMDDSLLDYLLAIVDATRTNDRLSLGVSPRGALFLQGAARANALFEGRNYCIPDDIKNLAVPVLAHRVMFNTRAGAYGRRSEDAEDVIRDIVEAVEVPV
ncbi:MAG TPA: MoxR family ATPase [Nitrospirota bacterium]|jgi:MoxR-like ATPase